MRGDPDAPLLKLCATCPLPSCEGCSVIDSAERYRKKERNEKWWVLGVVAVVFTGVVFIGGLGVLTVSNHNLLSQGHQILVNVSSAQKNNEATLQETAHLQREILDLTTQIKNDEAALARGNATVSRIFTEAGAAVAALEAKEAAICAAIPGCH